MSEDPRLPYTHVCVSLVAFMYNNHWYMWAGAGDFARAVNDSAKLTYKGMSGHLATVTTTEEFKFLLDHKITQGYIGASDQAKEGVFRWITGPEKDRVVSPTFWGSKQPDDAGSGEDCVEINGRWNDFPCSTPRNWIIEFECLTGSIVNGFCTSKSACLIDSKVDTSCFVSFRN